MKLAHSSTLLRLVVSVALASGTWWPSRSVRAGGTQTLEIDDFEAFDEGEGEGVAIWSSGKITPGFELARSDLPGTLGFTCATRGNTVFVGTSDPAEVVRVTVSSKTAEPIVKAFAKLEGVVVSALLPLSSGDLLAATLPGGALWRIDTRGKVHPFASLKVDQIWALALHGDRILAATGPKGELHSLALNGKDSRVVLDVEEKDLMSLLVVGGAVLVGTSPRAKLFQVKQDDPEGILLHDFEGGEVRALAMGTQGSLFAAVNTFETRGLSSLDALTKSLQRASLLGQPPNGTLDSPELPRAEATLHRVDLGPTRDPSAAAEMAWERWFYKSKQYFTSLLPQPGGDVLVSSSRSGKIYRVSGRRSMSTIADLEERQATALCGLGPEEVLATAGDGAAVYRLRGGKATRSRYRSEILDATHPSIFGRVTLRGRPGLVLRARSGPSEEPDDRWSPWMEIILGRTTDAFEGRLSSLPKRRYLELEVELQGPDSEVRSIQVFHAPENLPPVLTAVEISPPSFDDDDEDEPAPQATISWKADAQDDDDLSYEVELREEGAATRSDWIRLHGVAPLLKKELKWDLTTVPEGVYEVRVRASDAPDNGSARAKLDELTSSPFVVDRGRPRLEAPVVAGRRVTGVALDERSHIHDVAFSVDGGPFFAASPADGIFDSNREAFELEVPEPLSKGRHRIVLRTRDAAGNVGTRAAVIEK